MVEIAETWLDALARCSGMTPGSLTETGRRFSLTECEFLAPLPDAGRGVFCIGMNYADHDAEARGLLGTEAAAHPVLFVKLASAMTNAYAVLSLDGSVSRQIDWEVELGVVIGRGGRAIEKPDVADHVAGYTIVNDVTARDLQRQHVQWLMGKNVDASSPIGPWVTTLDEAGYPPALEMVLRVNGVEKQRGTTDRMIFDVPTVVSTLSNTIELQVGDVFATGTPSGVGFARQPPEFLQVGDVVEASIEQLGSQRNVVVAAERSGAVPDLAGNR
jgi:2-keto-4-pentenoate hydratase/2-oxohepta-3-ene-1,7-dioic acid hydratase in catechol pathway